MGKVTVIILVAVGLVIGVGLGVLIWWLVKTGDLYETIRLEGDNIGSVNYTAAFTRIHGKGDIFWWFYPTLAAAPTTRPLLVWLHGVTGDPPSYLANFGMFGPYDINLNRRNDSLVNNYNLLFVDAPIGTGFSTATSGNENLPNLDENIQHLWHMLQSFYDVHDEYRDTPIYVCSLGDGSQLAIPLTKIITEQTSLSVQLKGILLGNPIVSPALVLTKLGFYLEELAYIDGRGREEIESVSNITNSLIQSESFEQAFDQFVSLGNFINEKAGAISVNLNYIVEKLTRNARQDYFGLKTYVNRVLRSNQNATVFMDTFVKSALGITNKVSYDEQRPQAIKAFRSSYMVPIVDIVENILNNTDVNVTIYNGNLDAVSNTPGQLEWVDKLNWLGQNQFLNQARKTIVINGFLEGYSRISDQLRFYWINVAGLLTPLDNPVTFKALLDFATT